ncbi:hypothetical protein PSPTOT1_2453 [Pseudomonas syringae pv. tomato T1]|nr:hypothetical protein PSPTOT1_2453 [Pseudomonas syringae pv. tomato T1]
MAPVDFSFLRLSRIRIAVLTYLQVTNILSLIMENDVSTRSFTHKASTLKSFLNTYLITHDARIGDAVGCVVVNLSRTP